jgi:hypothetical protein
VCVHFIFNFSPSVQDPWEIRNVVNDSAYADVVKVNQIASDSGTEPTFLISKRTPRERDTTASSNAVGIGQPS